MAPTIMRLAALLACGASLTAAAAVQARSVPMGAVQYSETSSFVSCAAEVDCAEYYPDPKGQPIMRCKPRTGTTMPCTEAYCCKVNTTTPDTDPDPKPSSFVSCASKVKCAVYYSDPKGAPVRRCKPRTGTTMPCTQDYCCEVKPGDDTTSVEPTPTPTPDPTPEPTTTSAKPDPTATTDPTNPTCAISIGQKCYNSLSAAVAAAADGATVVVSADIEVNAEIAFAKSLTIKGSGNSVRRITTGMDKVEAAVLRATGDGQTVTLRNLFFYSTGAGYVSAFRTIELGDGEYPKPPAKFTSLTITNCVFKGFRQLSRGGSAVFVGMPSQLTVEDTTFINNVVDAVPNPRWEGGGALWVADLEGPAVLRKVTFSNNRHMFQHSLGGAFMVNWAGGDITIDGCTFNGNRATGGGAVYIGTVVADTTTSITDTKFLNNKATELGWGSRGGAMWVQYVEGTLAVADSVFEENTVSADRGAAIANNKVLPGGVVRLHAQFTKNTCAKGGAAWDSLSGTDAFAKGALLTLEEGSTFKGNVGQSGNMLVRLDQMQDGTVAKFYEPQWKGETVSFSQ